MRFTTLAVSAIAAAAVGLGGGCSNQAKQSRVTIVNTNAPRAQTDLAQPDFVVVQPLPVTAPETSAQWRIAPITGTSYVQSAKEVEIGTEFSAALQEELLAALKDAGIEAHSAADAPAGTWKTGVIQGYYFRGPMDSASKTLGYQLGGNDELSVHFVMNMREVPISESSMNIRTSLTSTMSKAKRDQVVRTEAKMVAKKLVDGLIVPAYDRRGWKR